MILNKCRILALKSIVVYSAIKRDGHPCIEKLPEFVKAVNEHPNVSLVLVCDPYSKDKIVNKVIENSAFKDSVVYKLDAQQ
jgi:hypothetical protein